MSCSDVGLPDLKSAHRRTRHVSTDQRENPVDRRLICHPIRLFRVSDGRMAADALSSDGL